MSHADVLPAASGGRRRWRVVLPLLVAALGLSVLPGVADAHKKQKPRVASFNLYLGTDLPSIPDVFNAGKLDGGADAIGFALKDVDANNFDVRAKAIAKQVKRKKLDLIGLQEASLWKIQIPTDGTPLAPNSTRAGLVTYDYIQALLDRLNRKAKSKKKCKKIAAKRKANGKHQTPCYRGYRLVVNREGFDGEFFGDFDNSSGPDGKTATIGEGAPNPYPSGAGGGGSDSWLWGNDDTGQKFGEPPPAQCADGIDNDGDGRTDYGLHPTNNETSGPAPGVHAGNGAPPWDCNTRLDNSEGDNTAAFPLGPPLGAPQDANMDHHVYSGNATTVPDALGNTLDPAGSNDCADNDPAAGPSVGADPDDGGPAPAWDAPNFDDSLVDVCLFHGIDGDASLTISDAILARRGNGVNTKKSAVGNYSAQYTASLLGGAVTLPFTRGWAMTKAKVRGKTFRFVNTHLESVDDGTIREDQASELVAPGGPADHPKVVLAGDLNSDPASSDPESPPAFNRLAAAGFRSIMGPQPTSGHAGSRAYANVNETGALLNNPNNLATESRIDHILTNSNKINRKGCGLIDKFANGLWLSDHVFVCAQLKVKKKGGKKKGAKKKK